MLGLNGISCTRFHTILEAAQKGKHSSRLVASLVCPSTALLLSKMSSEHQIISHEMRTAAHLLCSQLGGHIKALLGAWAQLRLS